MGRRLMAAALTITLCLGLSSCSAARKDADTADAIAERYSKISAFSANVRIRADYGDRTQDYAVRYEYQAPKKSVITLLEPEEVSGIRATLNEEGGALEFDGAILDTGPLSGTGLSPVECLPALMNAWSGGYVSEYGNEKLDGTDCALLTYLISPEEISVEIRTYFEKNTLAPFRAELLSGGERVLTCSFEDVVSG